MPDRVASDEPVLEPVVRDFAAATAVTPFLAMGRKALEEVQAGEIHKPEVDDKWVAVSGGPKGSVAVRIVRPKGVAGPMPAILYVHGGGWVFGSTHTHDRLVRELAVGAHAAVVFPEYTLSPEARYPLALEECHAVARWVTNRGADHGIDQTRLAVAGDSVGGNISAALTLLAKERGDTSFIQQVLFYPVTDASFDTRSYHQFAESGALRRDVMQWFWDQYTTSEGQRAEITASPLRATARQLAGLPPALVITAEADVVRDEGEAYADRLRAAGVVVTATRYGGATHDFVMLDALSSTQAARGAIAQAVAALRQVFGTDPV
ncbi:alpha/beta hydrolase [Streptomyces sp. NPDC048448]|uniref:alpha/beta hydrolase n=1 Tax=Streptomyces sp. NPDC048448 TaxID=3365554 RepID=UPI0037185ED8